MTTMDRNASRRIERALDEATASLERVQREKHEPIAVVGLSCRFPGGGGLEGFWRLLEDGIDAVTEVPQDRWDLEAHYDPDPSVPGKMYCRRGGFLDDVDGFDAPLFRVSPREAASMDPQQRILLEVTWEALERAGKDPRSLRDSSTSVHIGVTTHDYTQLLLDAADEIPLDTYYATGNAPNALAGRLSYFFGLHGPSMVVDTACSSSLVAAHLACQGLRSSESDLAIVGGVNLVLSPQIQVAICRANMLSPAGRCGTFAADADGYVRGEGCGVLVLKRLSDARRDHDPVLAMVRGSAVNQDGASGGFTVPHGPSQQALIRRALDLSRVDPRDVDYLEAHGTGTPLGDPIEVNAAAAVYAEGRDPARPLRMGSVKTNIGHLEAAAGVAGLIKTVLALQARKIPAHLHFSEPNPNIPWGDLPVEVPTRTTPWDKGGTTRIAAISSFGASGTNAHVIVEEAVEETPPEPASENETAGDRDEVLVLAADSTKALHELTQAYDDYLRVHSTVSLSDVCYTAAVCRAHLRYRCALTASTIGSMREKLALALEGETGPGIFTGQVQHAASGTASMNRNEDGSNLRPAAAGERFVEGLPVPWSDLYPVRKPIALPTYPFQHRSYWIPLREPFSSPDDMLFRCSWEPVEAYPPAARNEEPSHWVLVTEQESYAGELTRALEERGQSPTLIHSGMRGRGTEGLAGLGGSARESVLRALREAPTHLPVRLLYFAGTDPTGPSTPDATTLTRDALRSCQCLVDLVQCASATAGSPKTRIWTVTGGSQQMDVSNGATESALALSAVWGLGRTMATEYPDLFGGLIDWSPKGSGGDAADLISLVTSGADQLVFRDGQALAPKVRPLSDSDRQSPDLAIEADATYLITGGLGALGRHLARWLVDGGARHLVLVSRRGENADSSDFLDALRESGARIWAPRADAADWEETEAVVREIQTGWAPLRGVFHLAGSLEDRSVARLDAASFERVLRPKIGGGWNLHLLTRELPLDHFVLFSSLAAWAGPAGQGNYAAGNAFLDGLAHFRRFAGLPALSVNWGPWAGSGMWDSVGSHHLARVERSGVGPLHPPEAMRAMEAILARDVTQAVVARVDWKQLFAERRPRFLHAWAGHLVEDAAPATVVEDAAPAAGACGTDDRALLPCDDILDGDPRSLAVRLTDVLTRLLAGILQVDSLKTFDINRSLDEYGMDSLTATELKNRIASRLRVDLPLSHLIGGATISGLVGLLQAQLDRREAGERPSTDPGEDTIEMVI